MNRRTFLGALAAIVAIPKVLFAKSHAIKVHPWERIGDGKHYDCRPGFVTAEADGPIRKGDPVVLTPDGKVKRALSKTDAEFVKRARESAEWTRQAIERYATSEPASRNTRVKGSTRR